MLEDVGIVEKLVSVLRLSLSSVSVLSLLESKLCCVFLEFLFAVLGCDVRA